MKKPEEQATINLWPETAKILGIGKNAVYEAARKGEIPTIRIGGRILVLKGRLDQMLRGERVTV